jgi:hypothetical protein
METVEVRTQLREIPVTIDGTSYRIREMTGTELSSWRKTDGSTFTIDEEGRASITGLDIKDPEVELLSVCLYDGSGKRVPPTTLRTWSVTALQTLYKIAQDLNGLSRESRKKMEVEAKNS